MLDQSDVTACLVTRGDQPEMMRRIHESLIFDSVLVWDNSKNPDWKCAGRFMAAFQAPKQFVYWQDDDVIVPAETQQGLLDEFEWPIVANWGHGTNPDGYDDLPLVCCGAIADRYAVVRAFAEYGAHETINRSFMYEADFAIGVLYPKFKHVRLPFDINMPVAQHESRLVNQPWQKELKLEITSRARAIRDGVTP